MHGSVQYGLAEEVGCAVIEAGFTLVTGGLGGIMEAACRGARSSNVWVEGTIIGILPGNDASAANPFVDVAIPTGLGYSRNSIVAHSQAVIAVGGGAGTLSEIAYAWMFGKLIICMQSEGWSGQLAGKRIDERIRYPHIPDDKLFSAANALEAVSLLKHHLPRYSKHSYETHI